MQFTQALTLFITFLSTASAAAIPQSSSNEDSIITTTIAGNTVSYHENDPTPDSLSKRAEIEKRFILPGFACTAGKGFTIMRKTLVKIPKLFRHDKSSAPELAPAPSSEASSASASLIRAVPPGREHIVRAPQVSQPTHESASYVPTSQHRSEEPRTPTNTSNRADAVDKIDEENHYGLRVLYDPPSAAVDIVFVHGLTGSAHTTWLHNGSGKHGPRDLFPHDLSNARIMTFGYDADVVNFWKHAAKDDLSGYARDLLGLLAECRSDTTRCKHNQTREYGPFGIASTGFGHVGRSSRFLPQLNGETEERELDFGHYLLLRAAAISQIAYRPQGVSDYRWRALLPNSRKPCRIVVVPKTYSAVAIGRAYLLLFKGVIDILGHASRLIRLAYDCTGVSLNNQAQSIPKVVRTELPTNTDTFHGRKDELRRMRKALDPAKPGQKGLLLYGIGGSGKTQLALRFIMEHAQLFSATIWINASTVEHTNQSFSEAAELIASEWPTNDLLSMSIGSENWKKVMSRLRTTRNSRWLLVIDSVDDLELENYARYKPSCEQGSIIVTSIQEQTAEVFRIERLQVEGLDVQSGSELLFSRSFDTSFCVDISSEDRQSASSIVKTLNGLPLAIEQAGILVRRNIVPLSKFLDDYNAQYRRLMDEYPQRGILAYDKERSMWSVFCMLYNFISRQHPKVASLLNFIAILGPWQIPMSFFEGFKLDRNPGLEHLDDDTEILKTVLNTSLELRLALKILAEFCLLKVKYENDRIMKAFTLHRAISQWCLEAMGPEKRSWIVEAANELAGRVVEVSQGNRSLISNRTPRIMRIYVAPLDRCFSLLQRFTASDDNLLSTEEIPQDLSFPAARMAEVYAVDGQLEKAKTLFTQLVDTERMIDGDAWPSNEQALYLLFKLANVFYRSGELEYSEELYSSALALSTRLFGNDDETTALLYSSLESVKKRREIMIRHHKTVLIGSTDIKRQVGAQSSSSGRDVQEAVANSARSGLSIDVAAKEDLCDAARHGDTETVQHFLEMEPLDINYIGQLGGSALTWSASQGHESITRLLLDHSEIDVNCKDLDGITPLHYAARRGDTLITYLLLRQRKIEADSKDFLGQTPLSKAAEHRREAIVRLLLDREDVNADSKDNRGLTPLSWAASTGEVAIVRLLIDREDVDVNSKSLSGMTPLMYAAQRGHITVVSILRGRGDIDIGLRNKYGETARLLALLHGHEETAHRLY
ncbi:MAG: hypothetical protein Q9165_003356 [Trypethelium subeluteriae]